MAKLSAHGAEIGRLYYTLYATAYMADGAILHHNGRNWKLSHRLKPGVDPLEHFMARAAEQQRILDASPALRAWRTAVLKAAPISTRWKLVAAIEMMPNDPDGVWSEVCDGYGKNVKATVDDIAKLCALYRARTAERDAVLSRLQGPATLDRSGT